MPAVVGNTFAEASTEPAARGLAVAYPDGLPPAGARVTASDPAAGTPLEFGATVALSLAGGDGPRSGTPPPDSPSSGTQGPVTGGPSPAGTSC